MSCQVFSTVPETNLNSGVSGAWDDGVIMEIHSMNITHMTIIHRHQQVPIIHKAAYAAISIINYNTY